MGWNGARGVGGGEVERKSGGVGNGVEVSNVNSCRLRVMMTIMVWVIGIGWFGLIRFGGKNGEGTLSYIKLKVGEREKRMKIKVIVLIFA